MSGVRPTTSNVSGVPGSPSPSSPSRCRAIRAAASPQPRGLRVPAHDASGRATGSPRPKAAASHLAVPEGPNRVTGSPRISVSHPGMHEGTNKTVTTGAVPISPNRRAGSPRLPSRNSGQVTATSDRQKFSPRPRVQPASVAGARGGRGTSMLSDAQVTEALAALNMSDSGLLPCSPSPKSPCDAPDGELLDTSQESTSPVGPLPRRNRTSRLSRGASLTPYVPGGSGGHGGDEKNVAQAEDLEEVQSPLPSGLQPYVPAEVPYFGPVAPGVSTGSKLRLIAFDFDQTLAATHVFFRLKNVQSRAKASKHQDGRPAPQLVKLLLSGAVPFEEIWGGRARLDYLKAHLQDLSDLGVYMVVITKGAGRIVDVALQLAGLRKHFQAIVDPKTSMGAKLLTVQVLMNTAFGERLRPMEAALVDDEAKNLVIDISGEEIAALPPVFHPVEAINFYGASNGNAAGLEKGCLVGPETICRVMRVEQGIKDWQLWELVCAAAGGRY